MPSTWLATDKETVDFVFRHPDLFSSAPGMTQIGNVRPLIPLEVDPPDHRRCRHVLEPTLRRQINELIDGFIHRGEAELLSEFFIPYPAQVFLTMYGLPMEDGDLFIRWKDIFIREAHVDPAAAAPRPPFWMAETTDIGRLRYPDGRVRGNRAGCGTSRTG
jgi:cytochrome P450